MNPDLLWTLALLAGAVTLFVIGKPRMDVVALLVLVALPLSGVLTVQQSLSGFSDPNVILIAALFVIGTALVRTGIAYRLGDWLVKKAGSSETRLLILLMLAAAGLGSVMSSTGVVAIFIPVVLGVAARLRISPARLMMPLAFAGLISGMLTLVATAPNLVIHAELRRAGLEGFGFFSMTPVGLAILVLGIGYMLLTRRWLQHGDAQGESAAPRLTLTDLAQAYNLEERERRLRVQINSPLANQPLNELELRQQYGINVIAVERQGKFRTLLLMATGNTQLQPGDVLLVDLISPSIALLGIYQTLGLEPMPLPHSYYSVHAHELGLAEVAMPPESQLIGKTIQELGFRSQHKLNVVGLRRHGQALEGVLVDERLKASDTLLVAGEWKAIRRLQGLSRDFLVLSLPAEVDEVAPAARKAPYALLSLAVMIVLMVSGLVSNVLAALIACLLMGAFRCIDLDSAYRSIHWPTLILIVGMLPFAQALQQTGGIDLAVHGLVALLGDAGPYAILASLFAATALIGLFISNTATAVLMGPVAIATAQTLGVSPYPFALTVALAASAAFMTPISSPVNTLVLGPGQYRFSDFVRVGVPFTILVMIVSVLLVPLIFPL
ncbi:SLC13 family permease [Pseudomonas berkeleyensis]|uniref:SLC13 family permease n=1 Tax=Pseudomonas berkeleyensis TaxID=2726956 RepID=A0A7G5DKR6_9PSED|nr:SLC13 family permease [Pseudomonas berkeleyensis]QMV62341.1 SLC13 family permease [Pseudomonas berkeleyensis]WSO37784.1 SLC13 family permease [Pseudomonas berkeleyensis]